MGRQAICIQGALSLVASQNFWFAADDFGDWSKERADLVVRANAETIEEIKTAASFWSSRYWTSANGAYVFGGISDLADAASDFS